jgi:hypothetical protein
MNRTAMGLNLKLTISHEHRARWRALFDALGIEVRSPAPDIEAGILSDGASVGLFFVDPSDALPEELASRAPWLELRVADVAASRRALEEIALPRVDYHDHAHPYFRAPGGVVFRLAGLG